MIDYLERLKHNAENDYRAFSKKLIPDTKYEILGVRTPTIKKIAKSVVENNDAVEYLAKKYNYYEEYLLHGFVLGLLKTDIKSLIPYINDFLPKIDNWAICDGTVAGLKILKKYPYETICFVKKVLKSNKPYSIRFGIVTLLTYFLDDNFNSEILRLIANIKSEHYYVNMAIAWFFSVALVKQYEHAVIYLENRVFDKFVHNKTIQKAVESFRISNDKKVYLKKLKV